MNDLRDPAGRSKSHFGGRTTGFDSVLTLDQWSYEWHLDKRGPGTRSLPGLLFTKSRWRKADPSGMGPLSYNKLPQAARRTSTGAGEL